MQTLHITQREYQVWSLVVQGLTKKEVAMRLNRSVHTVNEFYRSLYVKLHIRKDTDLVREWFLREMCIPKSQFFAALRTHSIAITVGFLLLTGMQIKNELTTLRTATRTTTVRTARRGSRRNEYYL